MISLFKKVIKFCLLFCTILNIYGATDSKVKLSLISQTSTVGEETNLLLALRVQIAPGWKTYWRSPGITGYGLNVNWEGSKNIKSINLLWPLPHRAQTQMGQINAYDGEVVFPIAIELKDPTQALHASLQVDMLVCDESNCLPIMEDLTLDLPAGPKTMSPQASIIQQAMDRIPKQNRLQQPNSGPFYIHELNISGADDLPPMVHVKLTKSSGTFSLTNLPDLFLEIKGVYVESPKQVLSDDQKSVTYSAPIYPDEHRKPTYMPNLIGEPVKVTIGYNHEGFELIKPLEAQSTSIAFWIGMLAIAFIGGLILNIMPCVLPVLSLKVLSVMRHGGGHTTLVRQEFFVTVLGIIFSFFVLACGAILLKISGHMVGWGVQFQDPYFLIALIGVLTLFACNLFGFFEFRLPVILSSLGMASPHRERLVGSFLEGTLVTALATPCTAPFLGTAVAFALSRGSFEILSIFLTMGLGLASPFLLIGLFPKFATRLPKPGAWMTTIRFWLGFILALTAVWLVYVLIAEIGNVGAFITAFLMLVISLLLKRTRNGSEARKKMAWLGASLIISASFMLPLFVNHSLSVSYKKHEVWHPFEPEKIANYVKEGNVVVVSITADWCLTCQANKYFVLNSKLVKDALKKSNIIAMEADWTNHDPKITAYLKSFNQYGIPFYAVYGCKSPMGNFLGQILTPQKILSAIEAEQCP